MHGIVFKALHGVRFGDLHEVVFETPETRDVSRPVFCDMFRVGSLVVGHMVGFARLVFVCLFAAFQVASASRIGTPDERSRIGLLRLLALWLPFCFGPVKRRLWVGVAAVMQQ